MLTKYVLQLWVNIYAWICIGLHTKALASKANEMKTSADIEVTTTNRHSTKSQSQQIMVQQEKLLQLENNVISLSTQIIQADNKIKEMAKQIISVQQLTSIFNEFKEVVTVKIKAALNDETNLNLIKHEITKEITQRNEQKLRDLTEIVSPSKFTCIFSKFQEELILSTNAALRNETKVIKNEIKEITQSIEKQLHDINEKVLENVEKLKEPTQELFQPTVEAQDKIINELKQNANNTSNFTGRLLINSEEKNRFPRQHKIVLSKIPNLVKLDSQRLQGELNLPNSVKIISIKELKPTKYNLNNNNEVFKAWLDV